MALDAPTTPQPAQQQIDAFALQFLQAEETSTATLMGFYADARAELEAFLQNGALTASDQVFYRQLLDEANRVANDAGVSAEEWINETIPAAMSAGFRAMSSTVVPQRALEALSQSSLSLIRDTSDGIRQSVRQSIAMGILEGLPAQDVRQRILASGLTNIPHWPTVEYRAGVIARTETMAAFNAGVVDGIVSTGARYVRWITSPDEAVCRICYPRHGKVFRVGQGGMTRAQAATVGDFETKVAEEERARNPRPGRGGSYGPERGMTVGPDGKVLWQGTGEATRIRGAGLNTLKPGVVLTHFHPSTIGAGEHLSVGDVLTARNTGATIRAFNARGQSAQFVPDGKTQGMGEQDFMFEVAENRRKFGWDWQTAMDRTMKQVYGGTFSPASNDPYPHAIPLPKLPAHPRCRCTVKAEYRRPDGKLIDSTPEVDPKLPADAMGGDQPGTLPMSQGQIEARARALWEEAAAGEPEVSAYLSSLVDGRTLTTEEAANAHWGLNDPATGLSHLVFEGPSPAAAPGGELAGYNERLKKLESFLTKVRNRITEGRTADEALGSVSDLVRYTFRFNADEFTARVQEMRAKLLAAGFRCTKWQSSFNVTEGYVGVNTNWISPTGKVFELQFHTVESFRAAKENHEPYDAQKLLVKGSPEWEELQAQMNDTFATVPNPDGWAGLATHNTTAGSPAKSDKFVAAFDEAFPPGDRYEAYVTHYTSTEIDAGMASGTMTPLLTNDGMTGGIVIDHGDGRVELSALFNVSGIPEAGVQMLRDAVESYGVNYVECFGPVLNLKYEGVGFVDIDVSPFNPEYAPATWNYAANDEPDYHTMEKR